MDAIPDRLVNALRRGDCIPLVGAGVSCQAGYPSWQDSIDRMTARLLELADDADRPREQSYLANAGPLSITERFKHVVDGEEYAEFLDEQFNREADPAEIHRLIVSLPFPYIMTTNFDPLLELAYRDVHGRMPDVCWRYDQVVAASAKARPYILAVHGTMRDVESIVFTESDYARLQVSQAELVARVRTELANRHVLMLGYSLSDPDFRSMYLTTQILTGGPRRTDYTVVKDPYQAEVEEWRGRGVRFVAIDAFDQLPVLLQQVAQEVGAEIPRAGERQPPARLPPPPAVELQRKVSRRPFRGSSEVRALLLPSEMSSLLAPGTRALLVGPPGSGKSHAIRTIAEAAPDAVLALSAVALEASSRTRVEWSRAFADAGSHVALLLDGLDEVTPDFRRSLALQLRDLADASPELAIVVATRDIELPDMDEWVRWDLHSLTIDEAAGLLRWASSDAVSQSSARELCRAYPELFERPLLARLIGQLSSRDVSLELEGASEVDVLSWALVGGLRLSSAELVAVGKVVSRMWLSARAYDFGRNDLIAALSTELSDGAADDSPLGDASARAAQIVAELASEQGPFIEDGFRLAPRQRSLVDMLVATGLVSAGRFADLARDVATDRSWEHLASLGLALLPPKEQAGLVEDLWTWSPTFAIRTVADLPMFGPHLSRTLLAGRHEEDMVRLVRSLLGTASSATCVRVADVLCRPDHRSGHVLYFVVEMLERLIAVSDDGPAVEHAHEVLARLWSERERHPSTPTWAVIPAGRYEIGRDEDSDDDERPRHEVELGAFQIAQRHVTNEEFQEFSPAHAASRKSPSMDCPVVDVTWYEAMIYCRWRVGEGGRLPTEAEWEVAAQGPANDGRAFPWGDDFAPSRANIDDPKGNVAPVASYPPTGWDLYDMCGNVFDWCRDWYDEDYYWADTMVDPQGPDTGRYRVMRGGAWARSAESGRCSYRVRQVPETRDVLVGFRLAQSIVSTDVEEDE